ncbi:MAG: hypothetical protein BWY61_01797 [Firmicutes bacterium ADurb.Bin354]|nr:MAG: hypothetical protein BWY61_01797 [Firmicutes bacterium ADurb.Bin354]
MFLFVFGIISAATEDAVIAVSDQKFFERRESRRHILVGNIRDQDTYGVHTVRSQPLSKHIRVVIISVDYSHYLFFGTPAYLIAVMEYS